MLHTWINCVTRKKNRLFSFTEREDRVCAGRRCYRALANIEHERQKTMGTIPGGIAVAAMTVSLGLIEAKVPPRDGLPDFAGQHLPGE